MCVTARRDGGTRPHPGPKSRDGEADTLKDRREQQVLLVAVAAPALPHQLVLQGREIQRHGPAEHHLQVLEGDRRHMRAMQGTQRFKAGLRLPLVADSGQVGGRYRVLPQFHVMDDNDPHTGTSAMSVIRRSVSVGHASCISISRTTRRGNSGEQCQQGDPEGRGRAQVGSEPGRRAAARSRHHRRDLLRGRSVRQPRRTWCTSTAAPPTGRSRSTGTAGRARASASTRS